MKCYSAMNIRNLAFALVYIMLLITCTLYKSSTLYVIRRYNFRKNLQCNHINMQSRKLEILTQKFECLSADNGLYLRTLLMRCGDIHPNPGPNPNYLKTSLINTRSLLAGYNNNLPLDEQYTKLDEVRLLINERNLDIIALNETWLDESLSNDLLHIENFDLYRNDRNRHGGGVALYIKKSFSTKLRKDLMNKNEENLFVKIHFKHGSIIVGTWYRPPGQNTDNQKQFLEAFSDTFSAISTENPSSVICLGDFNDRCKLWSDNHSQSEMGTTLKDLVNDLSLHQIVSEPTRITEATSYLLDLIITDSPGNVLEHEVLPPLANLDHSTVYASFKIKYFTSQKVNRIVWHYKNADIEGLNMAYSETPWNTGLDLYDDIDDCESYVSQ